MRCREKFEVRFSAFAAGYQKVRLKITPGELAIKQALRFCVGILCRKGSVCSCRINIELPEAMLINMDLFQSEIYSFSESGIYVM